MSNDGAVTLRYGNKPGFSMRVLFGSRPIETGRAGPHVIDARVESWSRAYVITSSKARAQMRFFVIEAVAGGEETEFRFDEFFVCGRFAVVEKVNNPRRARQRWSESRSSRRPTMK